MSANGTVEVQTPTREELALALAGAMDETATKARAHAEAMREQGERLLRDAARLEADANKLLAGAESLGLEVAGESKGEVEEVADHGTTVNSRGEKITFEKCIATAQQLARFSGKRFADELALKPVVARRWLARLREAQKIGVDESGEEPIFEFDRPPPDSSPRPRTESAEERAERMFGRGEVVSGTGRASQQAKRDGSVVGRRRPGRRN